MTRMDSRNGRAMLNRQKILIEMLLAAARPVTKIELMKWCFVLRHEMPSKGGPSFYDFLPYHHGPYSFCLSREANTLAREGVMVESETTWALSGEQQDKHERLPLRIREDVRRVVSRFCQRPVRELIDYVYGNYPPFTVNSQRERQAARPTGPLAVYTAGYEGMQVDGFLNLLMQVGIRRLIDVRSNPVSRRYGFHKTTLDRLCGLLDIDYRHVPELGIQPVLRHILRSAADYELLFDRYESEMLPRQTEAIERVAMMVIEEPSVLVCMEADPCMCHRSRLALKVSERIGLPVVHLEPADD